MFKKLTILALFITLGFTAPAYALDEAQARNLLETKINLWLDNPMVIDAIKAQNTAHISLTEDDILALDQRWHKEDSTLIDGALNNELSLYLREIVKDSDGFYSEIFVMDNKGINVGQDSKTSDYWQGDEAKWQQTYAIGADALHLNEVGFDESSQTYQVQLSITISDEGEPIGAITIGLDAEMVE